MFYVSKINYILNKIKLTIPAYLLIFFLYLQLKNLIKLFCQ